MRLTILHTNDLHGHLMPWMGWEGDLKGKAIGGLAVLAGAISAIRREKDAECLLLDAGDLMAKRRRMLHSCRVSATAWRFRLVRSRPPSSADWRPMMARSSPCDCRVPGSSRS